MLRKTLTPLRRMGQDRRQTQRWGTHGAPIRRGQGEAQMSAEFDQLVAEFEKFQSKIKHIDDRFSGIGQMQEEIAALETSAHSPNRSVTVIAGPGGAIKDIRLSSEALLQQPGALAAEIMSTLQRAVAEVARKQAGIVDSHMGGELNLTDQVLQSQAELFGTTVEELRSNLEDTPPSNAPRTTTYDDPDQPPTIADTGRHQPYPAPPAASGGSPGDAFLDNLFTDDDYEDRR